MALERPAALVFEASTTTHSDHELPLTYFSIGMWKKRDRTAGSIVLLVLNMTKKFVFLVESRMSVQAGPSRRLQKVLRQISASSRSPFNSSNRQSNYVVAFEVEWGEIVGLDYLNRLCEDGRVALEAQQTVKREFQTMRDAKTFYLPAKTPSNPTSPEILSPQQAPQAHSTDCTASQPRLPGLDAVASEAFLVLGCSDTLQHLPSRTAGCPASPADSYNTAAHMLPPGSAKRSLDLRTGILDARTEASQEEAEPQSLKPGGNVRFRVCNSQGGRAEQVGRCQPSGRYDQHDGPSGRASLGTAGKAGSGSQPTKARPVPIPSTAARSPARNLSGAACLPDISANGHPHNSSGYQQQALPVGPSQAMCAADASYMGCSAPSAAAPASASQFHGRRHERGLSNGSQELTHSAPSDVGYECSPLHESHASLLGAALRDAAESGPGRPCRGPRTQRWPPPSTWTVPSHIFECRTVIFQFTDPFVPSVLRPAIQSNERLLKLYESGLPAWAMFMPAYGLWYRPWMRRVTYLLFIAISIFSMACGFYDLYKNVPYLDKVLRRVIGSLYLPSSAIFQWLEEHAQIRLSILLTYLFGKSMLFMQLLRWLGQVAATCRTALQPVADVLGPPFASLALLMQAGGRQVLEAGLSTGVACATLGRLVFGPPARLVWTLLQLFAQVLLPFYQVLKAVVMGPVAMVVTFLQYLFSGAGALWAGMRVMCSALTSTARAINSSARLAPAVQASAREVSWWYVVPADALELVRVSAMKSFRAVQAVTRFLIQICCDTYKHRLTLGMRMSRSWDAFKLRVFNSAKAGQERMHALLLGWGLGLLKAWCWLLAAMGVQQQPSADNPAQHADSHADAALQSGNKGDCLAAANAGSMPIMLPGAATAHVQTVESTVLGHDKTE